MAKHKRSAVFIALSNTVGHELVFRHYTSKVVVADHPDPKKGVAKSAGKSKAKK